MIPRRPLLGPASGHAVGCRRSTPAAALPRTPLRVLSLFTGIGGFDLACERAGMRVVAQADIELEERSPASASPAGPNPTSLSWRAAGPACPNSATCEISMPTPSTSSARSTWSAAGSPARTCPARDVARGWLAHARGCGGSSSASWVWQLPRGCWSKTSLACCHPAADGTLAPCWGRWRTSGMGMPGECWTLRTSDSPSDASACGLFIWTLWRCRQKAPLSCRGWSAYGPLPLGWAAPTRRGVHPPTPTLRILADQPSSASLAARSEGS